MRVSSQKPKVEKVQTQTFSKLGYCLHGGDAW